MYVSASEKINSYTTNKLSFIGNGTLSNPEALNELTLDRKEKLRGRRCISNRNRCNFRSFRK